MRTSPLLAVAGGGLAVALAIGAAVPAFAGDEATSPGSPPTSTSAKPPAATDGPADRPGARRDSTPLTADELARIQKFYADHPALGHQLLTRVDAWATFLDEHPDFAAQLDAWKALPVDERRAAVRAWLADHPGVRADLRELRADRREFRRDLRQLRRDLRPGSRIGSSTGSPAAPSTVS